MPRDRRSVAVIPVAFALGLFIAGCDRDPTTQEIVAAAPASADATDARLQITYPSEGTLFPPEIVAPTFVWEGVVHFGVTNMPGAVPRTARSHCAIEQCAVV